MTQDKSKFIVEQIITAPTLRKLLLEAKLASVGVISNETEIQHELQRHGITGVYQGPFSGDAELVLFNHIDPAEARMFDELIRCAASLVLMKVDGVIWM